MGHHSPIISRLHPTGRRGFTLLEGLLAAVVLAILVLGVCGTLSESYTQSEFTTANATAVSLARQLADEMVSKPMGSMSSSLGPGAYTSRSQYTQIINYHTYSDTSTSIPPLGSGSPVDATGADSYTRSVSVVSATPSIDSSPVVPTDFAIVTVTITAPNGQTVSIPQFVANYPIQR